MSKQAQRQHRQRFTDSASASDDAQQQQQEQKEEQQQQQAADEEYDPLANLLSLQLRKPAHWNWELNTSRSCSNIALPRILLYDHTGALLLDASGQTEQTYRPTPSTTTSTSSTSKQPSVDRRRKRAATANLAQSLQQARLPSEFHGLQIGEATPSPTRTNTPTPTRSPTSLDKQLAGSCIDFSTHELPDWQPRGASSASSRRSSSLRGVRFEEQPQQQQHHHQLEQLEQQQELSYPTPPSTSTLTTTANSSSSGPREKRRYRRSHSSGQRSILERFSMSRGRLSSPEYVQEEQQLEHAPRYFLRTSKAGTLVIKDESFSRVRQRRRRARHSSSENVLLSQDRSPAGSVVLATSQRQLPQQQQQQRSREPQLSTSEEEAGQLQGHAARPSRSRRNQRNCGKDVAAQGKQCSLLLSLSSILTLIIFLSFPSQNSSRWIRATASIAPRPARRRASDVTSLVPSLSGAAFVLSKIP